MRKRFRELYPDEKRSFCDRVLTDVPIPAIQETVYLIPIILII